MKTLCVPFSNGTEAMQWIETNCDTCNRVGCYEKKALELAWATGHITLRTARTIGTTSESHNLKDDGICYVRLGVCKNKNKPIIRVKRKSKHPTLF